MKGRIRRVITVAAVLAPALLASCASDVLVRRQSDPLDQPVENVAVLLFFQEAEGAPEGLDELATDAFTVQVQKYFPALVSRYEVRDFLRRNRYTHALSPAVLRELGEQLGVDGLFVGKITGYSEKESFLGWNGKPHFEMACRLLSTKTGRVLLAGQVNVEGSYVIPVNSRADRVVFGVKLLTKKMGLSERFGLRYVTRDDPIWARAMRHYEKKQFWEAARYFGAIVHDYAPSDLRDEAQFYMGRSLDELSLASAALEIYRSIEKGPFAVRALLQRMEIAFREERDADLLALDRRMNGQWADRSESEAARYLAGLSLLRTGRADEAIARLASVGETSRWYPFARWSLADPLLAKGDSAWARRSLEAVAAIKGVTESERRLRERAFVTLGDYHYARGDRAEAERWYGLVRGEFLPRAALGLAWIAAERGDYEEAIAHADAMGDDADPRWVGEAQLLAGTCEARLARFDRSAKRLETALEKCERWKASDDEQEAARLRVALARRRIGVEIGPIESEVIALLTGERTEEEVTRLDELHDRYVEIARPLESLEHLAGAGLDRAEAENLRGRIREKAEFSLVQVRYEQERMEEK